MKVNEIFLSINGEGPYVGFPATFIRLAGCSLRCSYCDTEYARDKEAGEEMDIEDILDRVSEYGCHNLTITGGEPLEHPEVLPLIERLLDAGYDISIETNGAQPIDALVDLPVQIIMDYKCPSSGMEEHMRRENLGLLRCSDCVKFVVGTEEDMRRMVEVMENSIASPYVSPIFGKIDPQDIVGFILDNKLFDYTVQLQLHKIIWDADTRGV